MLHNSGNVIQFPQNIRGFEISGFRISDPLNQSHRLETENQLRTVPTIILILPIKAKVYV